MDRWPGPIRDHAPRCLQPLSSHLSLNPDHTTALTGPGLSIILNLASRYTNINVRAWLAYAAWPEGKDAWANRISLSVCIGSSFMANLENGGWDKGWRIGEVRASGDRSGNYDDNDISEDDRARHKER